MTRPYPQISPFALARGEATAGGGGGGGVAEAILHIQHELANGTAGGSTTTATWNVRPLNVEQVNEIAGSSLASNQITLAAGTYDIEAWSYVFEGDHSKVRLRDTTGGVTLLVGINNFISSADNAQVACQLRGRFTLSVESVLELQHFTQTGVASNGFGVATTDAEVEVFADILICQVQGTGKFTTWIPASDMRPTVSNGCAVIASVETVAGQPDQNVLAFDATADEHAQFEIAMPKRWNLGTVSFQVFWTHQGGQTGGLDGVAWALQGVALTNDDAMATAYGTAIVVTDDQVTGDDLYVTAESADVTIAGTPADDDLIVLRLFRDVSDAADDLNIDAQLIGVKLFWTADTATDD